MPCWSKTDTRKQPIDRYSRRQLLFAEGFDNWGEMGELQQLKKRIEEKIYFFPPFAWAPPFFSSALAGAAPFAGAAASLPPLRRCCTLASILAALCVDCAAALDCFLCGLGCCCGCFFRHDRCCNNLLTDKLRCRNDPAADLDRADLQVRGSRELWPECRSASLIFSRYWGVE